MGSRRVSGLGCVINPPFDLASSAAFSRKDTFRLRVRGSSVTGETGRGSACFGVGDPCCREGPGSGVFDSANAPSSSASSWRSASKESSSSLARRRSGVSGRSTRGPSVCEADGRDDGCQSSMTSSVKNSERFPPVGRVTPDGAATSGRSTTVPLAVHDTSSHSSSSSSEPSSDSSSAVPRKFGSDSLAQPGASEPLPFCGGTRWELKAS